MSSNPQGGSWFSNDKPKLEPEPPFGGGPARNQTKKDYIPDDWEDDDGEDDTGPIPPSTMSQPEPEADPPSQSQEGRGGEKIKPLIAANSMASPVAKKRASPAAPYGDSGPSLPSFEPIVQILKRSTNPTGATPAPIAASSQKSLVEREREYQQARQRIFGTTSDDAISSNDNIPKDSDAPSVIQRQPQGPSSEDAVGFRGRSNRM